MSMRSASKRQKVITLEDFGRDVLRRRAALGGKIDVPRNGGKRRTKSKIALLRAIRDLGVKW